MNKIWTIGALLQWTQQYFAGKGIDSPRSMRKFSWPMSCIKSASICTAHYDEPLNGEELAAYRAMVKSGPTDYRWPISWAPKLSWASISRSVKDVLIPRPETEMLVETVVTAAEGTAPVIIDIGTGSGAIVLSLLHYLPQATGTGVDISSKALAIAAENGRSLGLDDRVTWIESDLFTQVPPCTCDWLVSNPPYLTQGDMEQLQPEVRHDPALALYGGDDGLDFYRRIAADSPAYVKVGGHCAVEIGAGQADDVTAIFCRHGAYDHEQTVKDYGGIDRVLVFSRKE